MAAVEPTAADILCDVCAKIQLDTAFTTGSFWGVIWQLRDILRNSQCVLCGVLKWMFLNTPGHEEFRKGIALATHGLKHANLYGLSLSFYGEDRRKSKYCSYQLLPFGSGSPLRHVYDTSFDAELVRGWLLECDTSHDCTKGKELNTDVFGLRVIDVKKLCIAQAPPTCKYAALSYVWGKISQPTLTSQNASFLATTGSLRWLKLPRTIADAMQICDALGLQYLWVDSLCLEQDSIGEDNDQVSNMHRIYRQAHFTLVAASGTDCYSGIPSLKPRSSVQFCTTVHGIRVGTCLKSFDHLNGETRTSTWNSRAWTMQEYSLSRRSLIFTSREYFLHCGKGAFVETLRGRLLDTPKPFAPMISEPHLPTMSGTFLIENLYARAVHSYLSRQLSYPDDILRAFAGLTGALAPYTGPFFWGLPYMSLRYSLCWMNYGPIVSRPGFPSWSWAGWQPPQNGFPRHQNDFTAFGSGGISKIWPQCLVYRWHSPTSMQLLQSQHRCSLSEGPAPSFPVDDDGAVKQGHKNALMRWMYKQALTLNDEIQQNAYEDMFANQGPVFDRIPGFDHRLVLTFPTSAVSFPCRQLVTRDRERQTHRFLMLKLEADDTSLSTSKWYHVSLHSEQQDSLAVEPITFIAIGHLNQYDSDWEVIGLPVQVDSFIAGGDDGDDQIVARRKGNPVRSSEDLWFEAAQKAIVHLW
jgi:hypothetical protein